MSANPGDEATLFTTVDMAMTASAVASRAGEHYPQVLGTPSLIREMERAAAAILAPHLAAGEVSVGVAVEISHLAPTPVGHELRSHARLVGREGKLFWFEVWSEDAGGSVGKGRHSRAIVDAAAIEARASRRPSHFPPSATPAQA